MRVLRTPDEFDAATEAAGVIDVISKVRTSSEIERHAEWLREDAALGFDRIYLHNVARDHQERFIDAVAAGVLRSW